MRHNKLSLTAVPEVHFSFPEQGNMVCGQGFDVSENINSRKKEIFLLQKLTKLIFNCSTKFLITLKNKSL